MRVCVCLVRQSQTVAWVQEGVLQWQTRYCTVATCKLSTCLVSAARHCACACDCCNQVGCVCLRVCEVFPGNQLRARGCVALAKALQSCPSLVALDLAGVYMFSVAGTKVVTMSCPTCTAARHCLPQTTTFHPAAVWLLLRRWRRGLSCNCWTCLVSGVQRNY